MFFTTLVWAADTKTPEVVAAFIEAFKANDRSAISKMIIYPLRRDQPIPSIQTESEFISRFDQVFDAELVNIIVNSDNPTDSGNWKQLGSEDYIMLGPGTLWLNADGMVIAVNYESKSEKIIRNNLINKEKKSLHQSVAKFQKPVLEWETEGFHIRIDKMGDWDFRYASWSAKQSTSEEPDLILLNGKIAFQGSGGNHTYSFTNGDYVYKCYVWEIAETDSPGDLEVFKAGKLILSQPVIKAFNGN